MGLFQIETIKNGGLYSPFLLPGTKWQNGNAVRDEARMHETNKRLGAKTPRKRNNKMKNRLKPIALNEQQRITQYATET